MKMKLATIFSLSTALVLTGTVSAHEKYDDLRFDRVGYFEDVDANKDGKVSRQEYLDYNSDSRRYDREWREDHWGEMIDKFDYNEDDHITTAEVEEYVEEKLDMVAEKLKSIEWFSDSDFDFDIDGKDFAFDFDGHDFHGDWDDEEFADRLEERMDRVHERIEAVMERLGDMEFHSFDFDNDLHLRFGPRVEMKRGYRFYDEDLDENEDGVISEEEFLKERGELFERLDKNGDGKLDEEELEGYSTWGWRSDDEDDEDE